MRKYEYLMRGPCGAVVKMTEPERKSVTEAVEDEHTIKRRRATFFLGVSKAYDDRFDQMTFTQQRLVVEGQKAYLDLKERGII